MEEEHHETVKHADGPEEPISDITCDTGVGLVAPSFLGLGEKYHSNPTTKYTGIHRSKYLVRKCMHVKFYM